MEHWRPSEVEKRQRLAWLAAGRFLAGWFVFMEIVRRREVKRQRGKEVMKRNRWWGWRLGAAEGAKS